MQTEKRGTCPERRFLRRLAGDRRGAVALIFALAFIPLVLAAGMAIDLSRAYMVKMRLQQAIDAAGLAAGTVTDTNADLQPTISAMFNANYTSAKLGTPTTPSYTVNGSLITISASASVDTAFMRIVGINSLTVNASSEITRETTGLEVVLVMDNTGSMGSGGKLDALKTAANSLVDILFGSDTTSTTVKIGLVPFAGSVNIGTGMASFVSDEGTYDFGPTTWSGCVMARTSPYDTTDDGTGTGGFWGAFYWADTPYPEVAPYYDANNWEYNDGTYNVVVGPPSTRGPNKYCPDEVTPLTGTKATLTTGINAMWAAGYTHVNLGAVWGWRLLSPDAPFSEGVAYGTPDINKAIIILTDGVNTTSNTVYTSYGYRWEGTLGSTSSSGTSDELDSRLSTICTNIKAQNIEVYTITFQLSDTDTQTLFQNCASSVDNYFNSPSNAELTTAFRAIGAKLKRLHLSK